MSALLPEFLKTSRSAHDEPEIKDVPTTGRYRVLMGWQHQNDTPDGLKEGIIWGELTNGGGKLAVYTEPFNSDRTNNKKNVFAQFDRVVCGKINFSMMAMVHPRWADNFSGLPRDQHKKDKRILRKQIRNYLRENNLGLQVGQLLADSDDDEEEDRANRVALIPHEENNFEAAPQYPIRARAARRQTTNVAAAQATHQAQNQVINEDVITLRRRGLEEDEIAALPRGMDTPDGSEAEDLDNQARSVRRPRNAFRIGKGPRRQRQGQNPAPRLQNNLHTARAQQIAQILAANPAEVVPRNNFEVAVPPLQRRPNATSAIRFDTTVNNVEDEDDEYHGPKLNRVDNDIPQAIALVEQTATTAVPNTPVQERADNFVAMIDLTNDDEGEIKTETHGTEASRLMMDLTNDNDNGDIKDETVVMDTAQTSIAIEGGSKDNPIDLDDNNDDDDEEPTNDETTTMV